MAKLLIENEDVKSRISNHLLSKGYKFITDKTMRFMPPEADSYEHPHGQSVVHIFPDNTIGHYSNGLRHYNDVLSTTRKADQFVKHLDKFHSKDQTYTAPNDVARYFDHVKKSGNPNSGK